MPGPITYSEWSDKLERFARGEDAVLSDLEQGSFEIDAGTVYRFYNKVQQAYVARKKQWLDNVNRLFQIERPRTENDLSIVLQNAKSNLRPLSRFMKLNAFPSDLRDVLKEDFYALVADVKSNLRDSFLKIQPRNEKMLLIVSTFDFFDINIDQGISESPSTGSGPNEASHNRRILF